MSFSIPSISVREEVKRSKHGHQVDSTVRNNPQKSHLLINRSLFPGQNYCSLWRLFSSRLFFCFQVINTSNEVKQSSVVIVRILGHLIKLRVKKVGLVIQMRNWLLQ